jgi:hypothetical protein
MCGQHLASRTNIFCSPLLCRCKLMLWSGVHTCELVFAWGCLGWCIYMRVSVRVCICASLSCCSTFLSVWAKCVYVCAHVDACARARADPFSLISFKQQPHTCLSSQAEGSAFVQLPHLLSDLLKSCPLFLPAAIKANIVPSLIHILMKMRSQPDLGSSSTPYTDLDGPLACLARLMQYDRTHGPATPISAITAILPLALDLFPGPTTAAKVYLMMLSRDALLLAPAVDRGRWGPGLLRAMVALLTGSFRPILGLCQLSLTALRSPGCTSHLWLSPTSCANLGSVC